jgi:hypothetical protein
MPATLTTVSALLKEIYQGQIRAQYSNEIVGLRRIESSSAGIESTVGGKYVTFPIRVSRNQGIGYRNENEALPVAGQQGYAPVRIGLTYGYGRVRFTGQMMRLAKTNTQAFANAMDMEMSGLKDDIVKDTGRIFYGNGDGSVLTANAAGTSTTIVGNAQWVENNTTYDLYAAGGTFDKAVTVSSISGSTITFAPAAAVATATGAKLVRTGSYNKEPFGLAAIVSNTGTLFNVDPNIYPSWKAVVDSSGGAISESKMITMVDNIRKNGGKVSLILTSLGVRRAYFNLLMQNRRYVDTRNFEGGFTGLAFSSGYEIPVVEDIDCPPGYMYFLQESNMKIYKEQPWSWLDDEGHMLKWVVDYDAFEAVLYQYWQIGIDVRNHFGVITGITEA